MQKEMSVEISILFSFVLFTDKTRGRVTENKKKDNFLSMYIPFFLIVDQKAMAVWKNQQNTSNEKVMMPSLFQALITSITTSDQKFLE